VDDIKAAEMIFSEDIGMLKGRRFDVKRYLFHQLMRKCQEVTVCVDFMNINRLSFLTFFAMNVQCSFEK
jgi:hypothetical protein